MLEKQTIASLLIPFREALRSLGDHSNHVRNWKQEAPFRVKRIRNGVLTGDVIC